MIELNRFDVRFSDDNGREIGRESWKEEPKSHGFSSHTLRIFRKSSGIEEYWVTTQQIFKLNRGDIAVFGNIAIHGDMDDGATDNSGTYMIVITFKGIAQMRGSFIVMKLYNDNSEC